MRVMEAHNDPYPVSARDPLGQGLGPEHDAARREAATRIWTAINGNSSPAARDILMFREGREWAQLLGSFQTRLYQLNERLVVAEKKAAKYDALVEACGEVGEAIAGALKKPTAYAVSMDRMPR
jgi:hypothetical protein